MRALSKRCGQPLWRTREVLFLIHQLLRAIGRTITWSFLKKVIWKSRGKTASCAVHSGFPKKKFSEPLAQIEGCHETNADWLWTVSQKRGFLWYGTELSTSCSLLTTGAGVVGVIGCFTPLAPIILTTAAIAGTSSAAYGTGRWAQKNLSRK